MILSYDGAGLLDMAWLKAHGGEVRGGNIIIPVKCEFYDEKTKKCKDYENRPESCQKFKVGCKACVLSRHSVGLKGLPDYVPL